MSKFVSMLFGLILLVSCSQEAAGVPMQVDLKFVDSEGRNVEELRIESYVVGAGTWEAKGRRVVRDVNGTFTESVSEALYWEITTSSLRFSSRKFVIDHKNPSPDIVVEDGVFVLRAVCVLLPRPIDLPLLRVLRVGRLSVSKARCAVWILREDSNRLVVSSEGVTSETLALPHSDPSCARISLRLTPDASVEPKLGGPVGREVPVSPPGVSSRLVIEGGNLGDGFAMIHYDPESQAVLSPGLETAPIDGYEESIVIPPLAYGNGMAHFYCRLKGYYAKGTLSISWSPLLNEVSCDFFLVAYNGEKGNRDVRHDPD